MWPVFFAEQLERDRILNERWALLLEEHETQLTVEILHLFSRLINAHHIWNSRLRGTLPESELNDRMPLHHWQRLLQANVQETQQFIDDFAAEEKIRYHDSEGVVLEELPATILFALLQSNLFYRAQLEYCCLKAGLPVPTPELTRL